MLRNKWESSVKACRKYNLVDRAHRRHFSSVFGCWSVGSRRFSFLLVFLTSVVAAIPALSSGLTYRTIATAGDPVPGGLPGTFFGNFDYLSLNNHGDIAFQSSLTGLGISSDPEISNWAGRPQELQMIARQGELVPCECGAGTTYDSLGIPYLGAAGQIAFNFGMAGPTIDSSNDSGILTTTNIGPHLIARTGDVAPGTGPDQFFSSLSFPILYETGEIGFRAFLSGPGVTVGNEGVWAGGVTNPLALLYAEGAPAHDLAPGVNYGGTSPHIAVSRDEQVIYGTSLTGDGVTSSNNWAIWYGRPDNLQVLVRRGEQAPDFPLDFTIGFLDSFPQLNNLGHVSFRAELSGPGVTSTNDGTVWFGKPESLSVLIRDGDEPPGTGSGTRFGTVNVPSLASDSQFLAFAGFISGGGTTGENNLGMWSGTPDVQKLVVRRGDTPPGMGPGVSFDSLRRPAVNNVGQLVFTTSLRGTAVDSTNNEALWVTTENGDLLLVARTGDAFDVDPDPLVDYLRTIASFSAFSGGGVEVGFASPLNDAGQVPFRLTFDDGSEGIFIANSRQPLSLINADFDRGELLGWIPSTVGEVRVVERTSGGTGFAVELAAGSSASIHQDFIAADQVYQVVFEYLFPSDTGAVEVTLDGLHLTTLMAADGGESNFDTHRITVDDPLLLHGGASRLEFWLSGPTETSVQLDNIRAILVPEPCSQVLLFFLLLSIHNYNRVQCRFRY